MNSTINSSNSGLVCGTRWTTVSLLNGALTHAALAAIHSRNARAPKPTPPAGDPIPLRPRKPTLDNAA